MFILLLLATGPTVITILTMSFLHIRKFRKLVFKKLYKKFPAHHSTELIELNKVARDCVRLDALDFMYINDKLRGSIKTLEQIIGTRYVEIDAKIKKIITSTNHKTNEPIYSIYLRKPFLKSGLKLITKDTEFVSTLEIGAKTKIKGNLKLMKVAGGTWSARDFVLRIEGETSKSSSNLMLEDFR